MPSELFMSLSAIEKRLVWDRAFAETKRHPFFLEKDTWIVWTLQKLFNSPFGNNLVFKGGTSLSKAYNIIDRFSEDLDITYDIRTIANDFTAEGGILPATNSQARRWTKEIRKRLTKWVANVVKPFLEEALNNDQVEAEIVVSEDTLRIFYKPITETFSDYIQPEVLLEFGARSTGEPTNNIVISCDADLTTKNLVFPKSTVKVMTAERTFWEKATAIHTICVGGKIRRRGNLARHWYDLMRLDKTGIADRAFVDRNLALSVAEHQSVFFREKDGEGNWIDYREVLEGSLRIVPENEIRSIIAEDYNAMVKAKLFYSDVPTFDELMKRLSDIQKRANSA